jgi:glycosyltransferase involved in cell wall biosynthesis
MAKYGYQFEALSPYIRIHEPLNNVTFHQVGSFKISPTSQAIYRYAMHSEFFLRSLVRSRKLLRERRIEIVHHMLPAVFNYTFSPLALLIRNLKQPFVFGPISTHFYERPASEKAFLPFTSRLHEATAQRCDRLIAITNQTRDLYKTLVDQERISVIPFGVDTETFKPIKEEQAPEKLRMLYAGSLYALKGLPYLLKALANVKKLGLKANLKIIGGGEQKEALVALTRVLGIEKDVEFKGPVPYSNMPEYYSHCDVFCYPTLGEPFGKAVIEAMACGKPVIATNVGGPAEIIQDRVNGLLVPPANPEAMAAKIARLMGNESERRRIGRKARESVLQRFSWSVVAEQYHQLYSSIL